MPELNNRDDFESRIATAMQTVFNEQMNSLLDKLGDPPSLDNLTPEDWQAVADDYARVLTQELERVYIVSAEAFEENLAYNVDDGIVNSAARDWARQYSFDLVSGIMDTTRTQLQNAVGDFFEQSMTFEELRAKLSRTFSPVRAEMIARTEVTRAAVEGEKVIAEELQKQGVTGQYRHQTRNDERVCPICGPRHDQIITDGVFPPLHIRCRCFVNWEPIVAGN